MRQRNQAQQGCSLLTASSALTQQAQSGLCSCCCNWGWWCVLLLLRAGAGGHLCWRPPGRASCACSCCAPHQTRRSSSPCSRGAGQAGGPSEQQAASCAAQHAASMHSCKAGAAAGAPAQHWATLGCQAAVRDNPSAGQHAHNTWHSCCFDTAAAASSLSVACSTHLHRVCQSSSLVACMCPPPTWPRLAPHPAPGSAPPGQAAGSAWTAATSSCCCCCLGRVAAALPAADDAQRCSALLQLSPEPACCQAAGVSPGSQSAMVQQQSLLNTYTTEITCCSLQPNAVQQLTVAGQS